MCEELGIHLRAVTLADMEPPRDLKELISARDQARVNQEAAKADVGQLKTEQSLRATEALKEQTQKKTQAETQLSQETTLAQQRKEVEEQKLKQALENADLRLQAARNEASAILAKAKAEAAVIESQNAAEVAGLRKAVQGFNGVQNFAQYHILKRLAPALSEIFAADDSEIAKLLTTYLTPGPTMSKPATGASGDRPQPAPGTAGRN
jgi:hypothetical protein